MNWKAALIIIFSCGLFLFSLEKNEDISHCFNNENLTVIEDCVYKIYQNDLIYLSNRFLSDSILKKKIQELVLKLVYLEKKSPSKDTKKIIKIYTRWNWILPESDKIPDQKLLTLVEENQKKNPSDSDSYFYLGKYFFYKDYEKANGFFLKSLEIDGKNTESLLNLCDLMFLRLSQLDKEEKGQLLERIKNICNKVIDVIPNDPVGYVYLFKYYMNKGSEIDQFIRLHEKIIQKNPEIYLTYFHIGSLFYRNKDFKKAVEYLNKGREIFEARRKIDPCIYIMISYLLELADSYKNIECYEEALQILYDLKKKYPKGGPEISITDLNLKINELEGKRKKPI